MLRIARSTLVQQKIPDRKSKGGMGGSTAKVPVGFNIREGGLPSVFLMYGTPRHAVGNQYARGRGAHPGMAVDQKLYDSIYGRSVKNKVRKAQKQVFEKEMKNTFG